MLNENEKAPSFKTTDSQGNPVSSKSLLGQTYVLYFYPKDSTPGCTRQACSIRDHYKVFTKLGIPVYGISKGSVKSHDTFITKFDLPFPILMDEDLGIANAFGVYVAKNMYGKKVMGIKRTTFIINEKGLIQSKIEKVDVDNHAQEILRLLKK